MEPLRDTEVVLIDFNSANFIIGLKNKTKVPNNIKKTCTKHTNGKNNQQNAHEEL